MYMFVCVYMRIHTHIYLCVYIYIYLYTHLYKHIVERPEEEYWLISVRLDSNSVKDANSGILSQFQLFMEKSSFSAFLLSFSWRVI